MIIKTVQNMVIHKEERPALITRWSSDLNTNIEWTVSRSEEMPSCTAGTLKPGGGLAAKENFSTQANKSRNWDFN